MAIVPDMIGLSVSDISKSARFYRLLGLAFPPVAEGEDFVEVKCNGYRISLNSYALERNMMPDWVEPKGQRAGLAFLCDSPTEVDATFTKLVAAGHTRVKEPWDAFWGQRYAVVEDPDGAHVSIFAPLAKP